MGRRLRPASLYPYRHGSVLVPLCVVGLPYEIAALDEDWALREELHVTAIDTAWIAERLRIRAEAAWSEISAALEGRRAGPVRITDELRVAREGDERTIVVMAAVDGLPDLYEELSARLGAPLAAPPTHVTLYTRPGGASIGLHDTAELRQLSRALTAPEDAEVREAVGYDAVFGV
jgi:hypothetical protein